MREIGTITHNGQQFSALGAAVVGSHVAGYLGKGDTLKTWNGRTMLDCRSERFGEYRTPDDDTAFGIAFILPGGRAIVGYCLGEGMLFRGELVRADYDELKAETTAECEYWLRCDQEDYDQFQAELDSDDE